MNPDQDLIELDRSIIAKGGLRNFIRLAWPQVEPARPFIPGWHITAIAEHLEAITAGKLTRLVINIPPGCMKSLTCCVFWPAWVWTIKPETKWGKPNKRATRGHLSLTTATKARFDAISLACSSQLTFFSILSHKRAFFKHSTMAPINTENCVDKLIDKSEQTFYPGYSIIERW